MRPSGSTPIGKAFGSDTAGVDAGSDCPPLFRRGARGCLQLGEVRGLLRSRGEPLEIGRGEHRVQQHQPLDRQARRHRATIPTRRLADDVV